MLNVVSRKETEELKAHSPQREHLPEIKSLTEQLEQKTSQAQNVSEELMVTESEESDTETQPTIKNLREYIQLVILSHK